MPILRPQFVMFPKDEAGFEIDDQYYIGNSGLLVKPVTFKEAMETTVYFSDKQPYYDYATAHIYRGAGKSVVVPAPLHKLPLFIRGGSIITTRERPRRSSPLMQRDPFTLAIALDNKDTARGELYLDDGEGFTYEQGEFVWRELTAAPAKGSAALRISSRDFARSNLKEAVGGKELAAYNPGNAYAQSIRTVRVEKIVVLGLAAPPKGIRVEGGKPLMFDFNPGVPANGKKEGQASVLVIKDPAVSVAEDWVVVIE